MKQTHVNNPQALRYRRLGKKILFADRLAYAVGEPLPRKKRTWRLPVLSRARIALVAALVIFVFAAGSYSYQAYSKQVAAAQTAAASKQQAASKIKSDAADACRREKAAQKADKLGTLTYDQLYDFGACDK